MNRMIGALVLLIASSAALASDYSKVNGSIDVAADQKIGEVSTVNGSITIGDRATVTSVETVNGRVTLGAHAKATTLNTVNGKLILGSGSDVSGRISNVNGDIHLDAAHVGGGIGTVNGDITVGANSRVEGGIHIPKASGGWFNWNSGTPRIVIAAGAVVQGTLKFEREVKLYVSERATIGPVEGATAIKFSGDNPPN
jgi:cytoskeletal protein CcmA (bactofilin family)